MKVLVSRPIVWNIWHEPQLFGMWHQQCSLLLSILQQLVIACIITWQNAADGVNVTVGDATAGRVSPRCVATSCDSARWSRRWTTGADAMPTVTAAAAAASAKFTAVFSHTCHGGS